MEFTWLNKQGVRSINGFEVQFVDRFTMEYKEDNKAMIMDIEDGSLNGNTPCICMDSDAITAWNNDDEPIDSIKELEIINNIRRALLFQKLELSMEEREETKDGPLF